MKVALFDDRFFEVYGAQENLLLMAQLGQELGHDTVFVTTRDGALAEEARRRRLTVLVVPAPDSLLRFEGTLLDSGIGDRARTALDLVRYNLRMARALRRLGPDVIVSAAVRPAILLLASRPVLRRPLLLYAQNDIRRGALAVVAGLASSRICLIGPGATATFPDWFVRRFARRFVDLPSGRDLSRFTPSKKAPSPTCRVVTVSSLTRRKAIHVLIDALAAARRQGCDLHLTVVGGTIGPISEAYLDDLRRQVAALGVEVEFAGWHDDVTPFLERSDVFALASRNEGLPGVIIEAMASGLPCVTTRAGSAGQLVSDANAGLVVEVDDVEALADALVALCSDQQLSDQMGRRGRRHVENHLSLEAFGSRFDAVLHDVAGPQG